MFQRQSFMAGTQVPMRGATTNPLGPGRPAAFGGFSMQTVPVRGMGQAVGPAPGQPQQTAEEGVPSPDRRILPVQPKPVERMPAPGVDDAAGRPVKAMRAVVRMCTVLKKLSDREVAPDVAGRIFWSYADHAKVPPEMAAELVAQNCPGLEIPPRPVGPPKELRRPGKEGFRGKTRLSVEEARELSELLDVVLAPLTPEEAGSELADRECLRELTDAGGFPIVERLQERLKEFLAAAQPADTFEISHGEVVVTGKAVECAEALGRIKTVRTVATVGGAAAGGTALLLLLGIL